MYGEPHDSTFGAMVRAAVEKERVKIYEHGWIEGFKAGVWTRRLTDTMIGGAAVAMGFFGYLEFFA